MHIYVYCLPLFTQVGAKFNIVLLSVFYSLINIGSCEDRTLGSPEFLSYLEWSDPRDDWN